MSKREELKKIGDELYKVLAQNNVTFEQAKVTLDYLSIKLDCEMKRTMVSLKTLYNREFFFQGCIIEY